MRAAPKHLLAALYVHSQAGGQEGQVGRTARFEQLVAAAKSWHHSLAGKARGGPGPAIPFKRIVLGGAMAVSRGIAGEPQNANCYCHGVVWAMTGFSELCYSGFIAVYSCLL